MNDRELFGEAVKATQKVGVALANATNPEAASRVMLAAAVAMLSGTVGDGTAAAWLRELADRLDRGEERGTIN